MADHVSAGHGVAGGAGAVLPGAGRGDGGGEDGQLHRGEFVDVAGGAVDDEAGDAFGDADVAEDVPEYGAAGIAVGVDGQHIAGLAVVDGAVDRQVVAFAASTGSTVPASRNPGVTRRMSPVIEPPVHQIRVTPVRCHQRGWSCAWTRTARPPNLVRA